MYEQILEEIAVLSIAPNDWKPRDAWGDHEDYPRETRLGDFYLESVDDSNHGDLDSHGFHHGQWSAALMARRALGLPEDIQISLDGNKWLVLSGSNLQEGIAGFGDSVLEALRNFRKALKEGG